MFGLMGSELKFSTANHPQTNGQTERINAVRELFEALCDGQPEELARLIGFGIVCLQSA